MFGGGAHKRKHPQHLSGMMLVGGQALNYWAETLGIANAKSTGIYGLATSEDCSRHPFAKPG
jgi:hypothetical protein